MKLKLLILRNFLLSLFLCLSLTSCVSFQSGAPQTPVYEPIVFTPPVHRTVQTQPVIFHPFPTPQPVPPPVQTTPLVTPVITPPVVVPQTTTSISPSMTGVRMDVIHTVGPGETFWRIGKMYDVPTDVIMKKNNLYDPSQLEMGQELIIPDAAPQKAVVPLYPSDKWDYIVIHHSATNEGNSLKFHNYHLSRGWKNGVGYHFVVNNNSSGKQDGQIEANPRWLKQQNGAHCKHGGMNEKGIGICLVGNFNHSVPTKKQFSSLKYLVETLARYYNIPKSRITVHGNVPGATTDCPGKKFPLRKLLNQINL